MGKWEVKPPNDPSDLIKHFDILIEFSIALNDYWCRMMSWGSLFPDCVKKLAHWVRLTYLKEQTGVYKVEGNKTC